MASELGGVLDTSDGPSFDQTHTITFMGDLNTDLFLKTGVDYDYEPSFLHIFSDMKDF